MNENTDSPALQTTYLESNFGNEPLAKEQAIPLDSPVRISVHSVRNRLADADGISAKAAIDGIVKTGLIEDDSCTYVEEVRFSQEKTKGAEYTVITLEAI